MLTGICAVVVSYHPDARLLENAMSLLPQVDELLVVDNGSGASANSILDALAAQPQVQIVRHGSNRGIAAALNFGARYALEKGYPWLATFDQDSFAPDGFIDSLLQAYGECSYRQRVAIVSPRFREKDSRPEFVRSYVRRREHPTYSRVDVTMTSGNLVRTEIFRSVGWFDEPFFIDYVDHEFCMRVRKHGWFVIEASEAILDHSCGAATARKVAGRTVRSTNHSATRRYYISRNRTVLFKRYLKDEPRWVLDDMFNCLLREPLRILLFERDRRAKMRATIKGVRDGVLNRLGPAPERI